jgi:hypothetical protein
MHIGDRKRPPLSPQEGWLSDGRQVLHFQPCRYDRWSQKLARGGDQALGPEAQIRLAGLRAAVDAATTAQGLSCCRPQSNLTLLRSAARSNAFKS